MPRIWRIRVTLNMPVFVRNEPNGGMPREFKTLNLYPEQCLFSKEGIEVWLKCKDAVTEIRLGEMYSSVQLQGGLNDPTKGPYYLETKIESEVEHEDAVNRVIGDMEMVTDFLSFQLNYPVKIGQLEACSPIKNLANEFDVWTYSGPPYPRIVKDAIAVFTEPSSLVINASQIRPQVDEEVLAALRWFAKGLAASAIIDKFTFYWIAFETLATRWPKIVDMKRYLKCPRCQETINRCPLCGKETETGLLVGEKIRQVGKVLGRDDQLIRDLYNTRHLVHGTMKLKDHSEIEKLPTLTQQLKALVIDAIKTRLGISQSDSPMFNVGGLIMWGSMRIHVISKDVVW